MLNAQGQQIIYRNGILEPYPVEFSVPAGKRLDFIVSEWTETLVGRFIGFDKLDMKWQWVLGERVPIGVDGRAYFLASITAAGNFTLEPAHAA